MTKSNETLNAERQRLEAQRAGQENWRLWGPYLSERAWGTVREDYSPYGNAWEYFDHDQARSRAYRWSEDGLGGLCDEQQRLCLALALWNERDPILKERAFGLTGNQGNHGEDVKEYYFYLDATPSHSYLRYLYKYPQAEYPYAALVGENARRSRQDPPYTLLDTGVFAERRYWDVEVYYAKADPECVHAHVLAYNSGPETATLHLLPTLWFRNTWSWEEAAQERPRLRWTEPPQGAAWAVEATHPTLGTYYLYGRQPAEPLFTENESNASRLWGVANPSPYVKDAFHRRLIDGDTQAVNPDRQGTKFAAWHRYGVEPGHKARIDLVLSARPLATPFIRSEVVFSTRRSEADVFYDELLPEASPQDHRIMRQALAGMIWSKQFFHYQVDRWLRGDQLPPPDSRQRGRNAYWKHMRAQDIISMPDAWEYPWFAAWDLAYHCAALALVDVDFAKDQIELMLRETYLHPNGQIPAYEWAFGDANPPVHAMGALKVYRAERVQRGEGDKNFLQRVFHKLLLNYAWWINRKDRDGHNVFEGGFLGLDNISVFDRSQPLPPGFSLKQADATGWMAMFALNICVMALELATEDPDYEDVAIQTFEQFMAIANAISGYSTTGVSLWDEEDGFYKDLLVEPDGRCHRVDVYSWVGLIPLFACEVVDERLLKNVPRFRKLLEGHGGGVYQGNIVCACPAQTNSRGEHLFALVNPVLLPRVLDHLLREDEFLSPYGVRAVSRIHATRRDLGVLPGVGRALIEYVPGESNSGLFGGNSNWRGPIWMPTNYTLVQALEKFHRFLGDGFRVPGLDNRELNLNEIATLIAERLVNMYRRDQHNRLAVYPADSPFQTDPYWKDLLLFFEYFHGDTGLGLGAAHQTGWTGLMANLVMRSYRKDIPAFWREQRKRKAAA
ncbi:MAG: MGH1-like glycoside hydrolase domain-containing protein [Chromatiales bacterium]